MNGITAEELMDCLEAAGSRCDAAVLERLWASVPPGMRLPRLSAGTVPELYRGGFAEYCGASGMSERGNVQKIIGDIK